MPVWWNWQTRVGANSASSAFSAKKRKCAPLRLLFPKNLAPQSFSEAQYNLICEYGEIGRRKRLKIFRERSHIGSNPITRTRKMGENQAIFPHFLRLGTDWEPKMRLFRAFLHKYTPRKSRRIFLGTCHIWGDYRS